MKKRILYFTTVVAVFTFAAVLFKGNISETIEQVTENQNSLNSNNIQINYESDPQGLASEDNESDEQQVFTSAADMEKKERLLSDLEGMPKEQDFNSDIPNPWRSIGSYGAVTDQKSKFSGRVLDIEIQNDGGLRIAAASGGLWQSTNTLPIPLSDNVPSLAIGSFDSQQDNSSLIIIGTGEPNIERGAGLYRTTNGGANWTRISIGIPTPNGFYKVRFDPQNKNIVHVAATNGYYRSDNAGLNWSKKLDGEITDVAFNQQNTKILYCGKYDRGSGSGGVYKSIDGGNTWFKMKNDGLPVSNVGRTSISVSASNPNILYVLMATDNPGGRMLGVFRTFPNDTDFIKISPPEDILGVGFGWYVNAIGVSPTNPAICLVGGIYLWRTSDFGRTWTKIEYFGNARDTNMHSDIHSIVWNKNGNSVWVGNDGGTTLSDQQGMNRTFNTSTNNWPITQFVHFDISNTNPNIIFGGSRDNAFSGTTNGGITWQYVTNGPADGSGIAIDPINPAVMYGTMGEFGGNWRFAHFKSTNSGVSWAQINTGIAPTGEFYTKIRTNNIAPINPFTHAGGHLYYSPDGGANWFAKNAVAFPAEIEDFVVRDYDPADPDQIIYVVLKSGNEANRIKFRQNSSAFQERSSGIPPGISVKKVIAHPTNINVAYVLLNPNNDNKMVYRSTNKGVNWVNIDGNLPDVNVVDLVQSPFDHNVLYLGTTTGFFKTTDAGATWFKWNEGSPAANIVSEMKFFHQDGKFIVAASTYGRGIWLRDESLQPPGSNKPANVNSSEIPDRFNLYQNFPNPFNPATKIKFDLPKQSFTKITVFDITGREVAVLVDGVVQAGRQEIEFNASNLSSGVYFYKINAEGFTDIKKMVLVK